MKRTPMEMLGGRDIRFSAARVFATLILLAMTAEALAQGANYNTALPDFSVEPGQNSVRGPDGSFGVESIDPFTGALKIVATDLVVPSNGGLDLVVTRTYQSIQRAYLDNVPAQNYMNGRTVTGIGWDIHFGRLWRSFGSEGVYPNASDTANGCRVGNGAADDNPVLELPDGTRQQFIVNDASGSTIDYAYITRDRWIARCLPINQQINGQGGFIVVSPAGVRYRFNYFQRVNSGAIGHAYHPTLIEHPNGTSITITYHPASGAFQWAAINEVAHSEGSTTHKLTFEYDNVATNQALLRRIRLGGSGPVWTYNYQALGSPYTDYFHLTSVQRPDGPPFNYTYHSATATNGKFSLERVTTPLDGTVTYVYKKQAFPRRATGPSQLVVVDTKTTGGPDVNGGTWAYTYTPAPATGSPTTDLMKVAGPQKCEEYTYQGGAPATNQTWRVGTLLEKKIRNSSCGTTYQTETYVWGGAQIAEQDNFFPPGSYDNATFSPQLTRKTVNRGGRDYVTELNQYDTFGNAREIVETGDASRTTNLTYLTDTSKWVIRKLKNETIEQVGDVYNSSGQLVLNANNVVVRDFHSSSGSKVGLVQTETRNGVATSFDYHTGSGDGGELSSLIDGKSRTTTFSSYKRGIAERETRASLTAPSTLNCDGATSSNYVVCRTINSAGTVANQSDEVRNQTQFGYNNNNELTSIVTARTDDADVTINRTGRIVTITRGAYVETRTYSGLGLLIRVEIKDTSVVPNVVIGQNFQYDEEGRRTRVYLPNSTTLFKRTDYDPLGRVTALVHPDGKQVLFAHSLTIPNQTVATDERGFMTTLDFRSYGDPDQRDVMITKAERGDTPGPTLTTTTTLLRNKIGQIAKVTQEGVTRTFEYDWRFYLIREIDPQLGTISYGRDALGNLTSKQVAGSATTSIVLDDRDRVDLVTYLNQTVSTPPIDYGYYKNNRPASLSRGSTRWDYLYDANLNLTSEVLQVGSSSHSLTYEYSNLDALRYVTYPSGLRIDYEPNGFGRATKIRNTSSGTNFINSISYWPNAQINTLAFANGTSTSFGQDTQRLWPTSLVTTGNAALSIINQLYDYDDAGNVRQITDFRDSSNTRVMTYDGLGQLRTASGPWGSGALTYDGRGNIRTKNFGGDALTFNYNVNTDRFESIGGTYQYTFGYDVYGNINSYNSRTFGFDESSDLVSYTGPGGNRTYEYDGNRRLAREVISGNVINRTSVYNHQSLRMYEEDTANFQRVESIYVGRRLIASRATCYSAQDTDADGIPDCYEYRGGLDKNSAGDAVVDSDGDGLTNRQEYDAGTDYYRADSDADSLTDGYETTYGLGALVSNSSADTDGDGLTNLQEFQLGTRPNDADTDNDGIPDGQDPKPLFNPATLIPIIELILGS